MDYMDFKVGDIIYIGQDGDYNFGEIKRIEEEKLWCYWSCSVGVLPKTKDEFERLDKRNYMQYVTTYSTNLKGKLIININRRIS